MKGNYQDQLREMFRKLDDNEVKEFQEWARHNYIAGTDISKLWHPVVQEECKRMNKEEKWKKRS